MTQPPKARELTPAEEVQCHREWESSSHHLTLHFATYRAIWASGLSARQGEADIIRLMDTVRLSGHCCTNQEILDSLSIAASAEQHPLSADIAHGRLRKALGITDGVETDLPALALNAAVRIERLQSEHPAPHAALPVDTAESVRIIDELTAQLKAFEKAQPQHDQAGEDRDPRIGALQEMYKVVDQYIVEYEEGESGYSPNDRERFLIQDAIAGLLSDETFIERITAWQDFCRANFQPAPPSGWWTMESAPECVPILLGWSGTERIEVGHKEGRYCSPVWDMGCIYDDPQPTHWMPLPEPPKG